MICPRLILIPCKDRIVAGNLGEYGVTERCPEPGLSVSLPLGGARNIVANLPWQGVPFPLPS